MTARLVEMVARGTRVNLDGTFYRHTGLKNTSLVGGTGGRWGGGGYPVLYTGRPPEAVVAEAYRWIVDQTEGLSGDAVHNRMFLTINVSVTDVLDLRRPDAWAAVGLSEQAVYSSVNDPMAYPRCQAVSHAAHQLGMRGIIAPAASRLGETLALFTRHLSTAGQSPTLVAAERWDRLPPDPRVSMQRLRLASGPEGQTPPA